MWARNLLFVGLSLAAVTALSVGLTPQEAQVNPSSFDPERFQRDGSSEVVDRVDAEFEDVWDSAGLSPAPLADDPVVARRLAFGLLGTVPSLEELRQLERLPSGQRIDWWVSRILEDRRYADYVAERLARAYVGTEGGPFLVYRRRRFVSWLSDQLYANRPYDELVRSLISESGLWTDSPAVNFVSVTLDQNNDNQPDPIRLAGRTSRAFLGMRIDCLQCHDDMLGQVDLGTQEEPRDGLQSHFHELAAFFGGTESSLLGITDGSGSYEYKYLHKENEEVVPPTPPFLPEIAPGSGSRRQQLAQWVTHTENKAFARATVNRVWAIMSGKPLVEPIDDIPLYGDHPAGLETLARDFVDHGFDLQRLIRIIAATKVYRRDSRADVDITSAHEEAWAAFPVTRLRPDQVAGGIIQAASLKTIDANSHILFQVQRFGQQNDFIKRYGDGGGDEFGERAGTIGQRLLMMNGKLVKERTEQNIIANAATKIAALAPDDESAVETAYLAVLSRHPLPAETDHFVGLLSGKRGPSRQHQLEDLYWVLINSTEFSWNH